MNFLPSRFTGQPQPDKKSPALSKIRLTVTDNELGLKDLHVPAEGTTIEHDIIAVHGIGAHPDQTWCKKVTRDGEQIQINWLAAKDMLPAAVPKARIMRFGYRSQWFGDSPIVMTVSNVAELLLNSLRRRRKDMGSQTRPLMFIAHSFGGLAVIKALQSAANESNDRHIFDSVTGIVFLGTPFRGAEPNGRTEMISRARKLYIDVHPSILRITEANDEMLKTTLNGFLRKREESRSPAQLVCFYELEPCDVARVVNGKQTNPKTIRVDESSGSLDAAKKIPMQRNHFNMNKFEDPNDDTYQTVQEEIVEIVSLSNRISQYHNNGGTRRGIQHEGRRKRYSIAAESHTPGYSSREAPIIDALWDNAPRATTSQPQYDANIKILVRELFWAASLVLKNEMFQSQMYHEPLPGQLSQDVRLLFRDGAAPRQPTPPTSPLDGVRPPLHFSGTVKHGLRKRPLNNHDPTSTPPKPLNKGVESAPREDQQSKRVKRQKINQDMPTKLRRSPRIAGRKRESIPPASASPIGAPLNGNGKRRKTALKGH